MKTRKDMSKRQFFAALKRRGFVPAGCLGYVDIGDGYLVSIANAKDDTRRSQLAYLIKRKKQREAKHNE